MLKIKDLCLERLLNVTNLHKKVTMFPVFTLGLSDGKCERMLVATRASGEKSAFRKKRMFIPKCAFVGAGNVQLLITCRRVHRWMLLKAALFRRGSIFYLCFFCSISRCFSPAICSASNLFFSAAFINSVSSSSFETISSAFLGSS